jgi:phosphatidylinositol-3-phosphatase
LTDPRVISAPGLAIRPRVAGPSLARAVLACAAVIVLAACATPVTPSSTPLPTVLPTATPPVAGITRVVVVWMENAEATEITATSMPYLYGLSSQYGLAAEMYGVAHPSQPNYIALWSGSTQGVSDNGKHDLTAPSLSTQVTAAGKEWRVYAQDVPGNCFTGSSAKGGIDGPGVAGTYVRKHNPAISFTAVQQSASECAKIQPLAAFDPTAFDVAFVEPNLCNDMHDCSPASGDAFLKAFLPSVFNSPDWSHTLLIVSFDEGSSDAHGGGAVFTLVAREGLSGVVSTTIHDHYDVLRTIEDLLGLPCLAAACNATPLTEFLP